MGSKELKNKRASRVCRRTPLIPTLNRQRQDSQGSTENPGYSKTKTKARLLVQDWLNFQRKWLDFQLDRFFAQMLPTGLADSWSVLLWTVGSNSSSDLLLYTCCPYARSATIIMHHSQFRAHLIMVLNSESKLLAHMVVRQKTLTCIEHRKMYEPDKQEKGK